MSRKVAVRNGIITISLPAIMFILMFITTRIRGIEYYGHLDMWKTILNNLGLAVSMGTGIAMQLRHGRFDFSGGATMILSGILGGYYTLQFNGGPIMLLILC